MANIAMCTCGCEKADLCYRKTAIPEKENQFYVDFHQICFADSYNFFYEDRTKKEEEKKVD